MNTMTDYQFETILEMVNMVLDGCDTIDEAKKKVEKLIKRRKDKEQKEKIKEE